MTITVVDEEKMRGSQGPPPLANVASRWPSWRVDRGMGYRQRRLALSRQPGVSTIMTHPIMTLAMTHPLVVTHPMS